MTRLATLLISLSLALPGAACEKKKSGPTDGGGGGAWLVGQDGTMINLTDDAEQVGDYDIDIGYDFRDITCRGSDTAWVVGDGGTLLRTFDAGASWQLIETATTAAFHSVAAANRDVVYVAGHRRALRSQDDGDTWQELANDARDWTAVATAHDGRTAIFGTASGELWRYADGELTAAGTLEAAVRGVSMNASGAIAYAVGDDGHAVRSIDGGVTWMAITTDAGNLHDVWTIGDGSKAFAVGDGGQLVTLTDAGATLERIDAGARALYGLHVSSDGVGLAVGAAGTALMTYDHGRSWTAVDLGTDRDLHAVDDIHTVPHW